MRIQWLLLSAVISIGSAIPLPCSSGTKCYETSLSHALRGADPSIIPFALPSIGAITKRGIGAALAKPRITVGKPGGAIHGSFKNPLSKPITRFTQSARTKANASPTFTRLRDGWQNVRSGASEVRTGFSGVTSGLRRMGQGVNQMRPPPKAKEGTPVGAGGTAPVTGTTPGQVSGVI